MFCPKCGQEVPDSSQFCGKCGADLRAVGRVGQRAGGDQRPRTAPANAKGATGTAVATSSLNLDSGKMTMRRGLIKLGILLVAAIVIIAIGVTAVTRCTAKGAGSAEELADSTAAVFTTMFEDSGNESAARQAAEGLLNLFPDGTVDAIIRRYGYDDTEELLDNYSGLLGSYDSLLGSLSNILDDVDLSVLIHPEDTLDSGYIDNVNEALQDYGLSDLVVQDAMNLTGEITVTAKTDIGSVSAGDGYTQDLGSIGLCAIEIGGRWYLWSSSFKW